jgi:hypothetical protein
MQAHLTPTFGHGNCGEAQSSFATNTTQRCSNRIAQAMATHERPLVNDKNGSL